LRKLILTVVALSVLATATGSTAKAYLQAKPKNNTNAAILASQTANLKHARYVCRRGAHAHKRWACHAMVWLSRERLETLARMIPHIKYRSAWLCIFSHEHGADRWRTNTGNGYYGGLQMDWGFMSTYGSELLRTKGTADKWTPYEQMMVAEKAHDNGRGFYPWPNTARYCGLI
jgi:hypothetical protein